VIAVKCLAAVSLFSRFFARFDCPNRSCFALVAALVESDSHNIGIPACATRFLDSSSDRTIN
jgi:hypothetical protein